MTGLSVRRNGIPSMFGHSTGRTVNFKSEEILSVKRTNTLIYLLVLTTLWSAIRTFTLLPLCGTIPNNYNTLALTKLCDAPLSTKNLTLLSYTTPLTHTNSSLSVEIHIVCSLNRFLTTLLTCLQPTNALSNDQAQQRAP